MANAGLKLEVVTSKFNQMLEELAAIDTTVEFATVVRAEAAAVAAGAMSRTKAASVTKIRERAAARKFFTLSGKVYYLGNRYPDHLWHEVDDGAKEALKTRLEARGISKQSWLHLAHSMGREMKAPAYVVSANYKGEQYPTDGASSEAGSASAFTLTITNRSPVVQKANGTYALIGAMSARANYFRRNMEHHFALTFATRAKKYPGIFTSPVPPAASSTSEVPSGN